MVMKIWEDGEGRRGDHNRITTMWIVDGASETTPPDEQAARAAAIAQMPTTLLQNVNGVPHYLWRVTLTERVRTGIFRFSALYLSPQAGNYTGVDVDELQENEWTFSWDTMGNRQRAFHSVSTKAYQNNVHNTQFDNLFSGLVDVDQTVNPPKANGVDIVVPGLRFIIRGRWPTAFCGIGYAQKVSNLTGSLNDAVFPPNNMPFVDQQFEQSEVLFLGAHGSYNSNGTVDIDLHFEAKPNYEVKYNSFAIYSKKGHDFVWHAKKFEVSKTQFGVVVVRDLEMVESMYVEDDLTQLFSFNP